MLDPCPSFFAIKYVYIAYICITAKPNSVVALFSFLLFKDHIDTISRPSHILVFFYFFILFLFFSFHFFSGSSLLNSHHLFFFVDELSERQFSTSQPSLADLYRNGKSLVDFFLSQQERKKIIPFALFFMCTPQSPAASEDPQV